MKIIVDHIYGPVIKKMHNAGWRIYDDTAMYNPESPYDIRQRNRCRRACGVEMIKEFESLGDAVRDFEKITGYDAISDTDQSGCSVFTFKCPETEICEAGWRLGAHLYKNWFKTPRECLEALNK